MSTWLRKTKNVPGSAPGGLVWNTTEDVVEVEDDVLAADLLEIPDAGYVSVAAPDAEPEQTEGEQQAPEGEAAAPAKTARKTAASKAAAKTPVQE